MKGRMAALDAACARANPGLMLVAAAVVVLDLAVAAHRWAPVRPAVPVSARTAPVAADRCPLVLAPELRDMAGRD